MTACTYVLRLHQCEPPSRVQADGTGLARVEPQGLAEIGAGWTLDAGMVVVKARVRRIEIE